MSKTKVNVIYFADSLGSASPSSISEIIQHLKKEWEGPLGIHAHDNKGLALTNTLKAIECDVEWVDSTIIVGRVRDAKTEELIIELNKELNISENEL